MATPPPPSQKVSIYTIPRPKDWHGPFGGFSGLVYASKESDAHQLVFYAITDRGPNGKATDKNTRPFIDPSYSPKIVRFVLDRAKGTVHVNKMRTLKRPDGKPITGLPNSAKFDETPVDRSGKTLSFDPWGVDAESLALSGDGDFWIGGEYGPSLLKTDANGKTIQRWMPPGHDSRGSKDTLPAILNQRVKNRGFEGLAWTWKRTLIAFMQSELASPAGSHQALAMEFDPYIGRSIGLYKYPLNPEGEKIGDAALLPDGRLLVLEQNGKTGSRAWQKLFAVDFHSVRPDSVLKKTVYLDLTALGLEQFQKLEGLAVVSKDTIALVNDNDFGINPHNTTPPSLIIIGPAAKGD